MLKRISFDKKMNNVGLSFCELVVDKFDFLFSY